MKREPVKLSSGFPGATSSCRALRADGGCLLFHMIRFCISFMLRSLEFLIFL
jgi:hypothetical protein